MGAGNGSFRQTLAYGAALRIVIFAPALCGQTILLDANHSSRVFEVASGSTVVLAS